LIFFLRLILAFIVLRIIWKLLRGVLGNRQAPAKRAGGFGRPASKGRSRPSTVPWDEREVTDVGYEEVSEREKAL
jgi:hypothetical protein